jgi:methionyl-tRNA synthetase
MRATNTPRRYLLLPSLPTPNGALHLGHIAGPLLKMDIARRIAQRRGDLVVTVFGFDVFESYMLLRAELLDVHPAELSRVNIARIKDDLRALDLDVDLFFDPLEPETYALYWEKLRWVINELTARGFTHVEAERLLFDPDAGRYLTGSSLSGTCPGCGAAAGGFSCEACGRHLLPAEVLQPYASTGRGLTITREVPTLWFRGADSTSVIDALRCRRVDPEIESLLRAHLERRSVELRMTVPGTWGVPYPGLDPPTVVYSGFASIAAMLASGLLARGSIGSDPFAHDSDVEIICSFGIDNAVSRLLSCIAAPLALGTVHPPDRLWTNHFYHLEWTKFSTSRNHAVWASSVPQAGPLAVDLMRFFLAETSPVERPTNYSAQEFRTFHQSVTTRLLKALEAAAMVSSNSRTGSCPSEVSSRVGAHIATQHELLAHGNPNVGILGAQVRSWLDEARANILTHNDAYWWQKGLALIAHPLMPRLAGRLWSLLGAFGVPTIARFGEPTIPQESVAAASLLL